MSSQDGRRGVVHVLVVAASAVLVLALVAGYVRHTIVNSDQFANRATAAVRDPSVRDLVAEQITDQVVLKQQQDLLAARPIIESAASGIIASRPFTSLFRAGVRDAHRALFDRDQNTVTLTLRDVGTVLATALERFKPGLARKLDSAGHVALIKRDFGSLSATLVRFADGVRLLAVLLGVLFFVLAGAAILVARDRRRAVVELGMGTAAAGVLLVVAYSVARQIAVHHVHGADQQAAAGAVWDAFARDLRTAAWIVAAAGAIVAGAAASLIKPIDLREPAREVWRRVRTEPGRPLLRVLRGIGLVAAGIVVIVARDAVLQLVVTVAGVVLVYAGITALLRMIYSPAIAEEREPPRRRPRVRERRHLVAAVTAAGLIAAAAAVFLASGGTTTAAPAQGGCEGHRELCDRPLDEVALAATHNAMSVPLPGWFSSEQDRPIRDQLNDGVRGLLIDTHYADRLPNGKLRTDLSGQGGLKQVAEQDGVSKDSVDAALRIRDRLGFSGKGERGMYLCHTLCEIGGTTLSSVLRDLHDFLVSHPDDVVVVINQDYVTPADFVGAVRTAGLESMVYRGPTAAGKWPTLREMIDSNQRVVFLAENHAGGAPWYHPAYSGITQETPYTFKKVALLTDPADLVRSCRPNRGTKGAPLFLMNHWISTDPVPLPSDAAKVNAYTPLLARAQECRRLRDHLPNLVAVNFYRRGDVFRVVDTLNGVR